MKLSIAFSFLLASSTAFHLQSPSTRASALYAGVERNANFAKLAGGYLFPEIARRRTSYLEENAKQLGTKEGYSGYGAEQGMQSLRAKIAEKLYNGIISADEVFVSDGAKPDIMRLQQMFGPKVVSAVQDPSYPVYVDTSVIMGQTGEQDTNSKQYDKVIYMPCTPENGFFPDYSSVPRADIVYLCSPK